jgi:hypothetical protein
MRNNATEEIGMKRHDENSKNEDCEYSCNANGCEK